MKSLWPEKFNANEANPPSKILAEQSELLPKLTGDMVRATITDLSAFDAARFGHQSDFAFSFNIGGKFLKGYSFKVFHFSHPVILYPVNIGLDEEIALELAREVDARLETEEEFVDLIGKIFASERLKTIIGSIIQLSGTKSSA